MCARVGLCVCMRVSPFLDTKKIGKLIDIDNNRYNTAHDLKHTDIHKHLVKGERASPSTYTISL